MSDNKARLRSASGSTLPSVAVVSDQPTFKRSISLLKEAVEILVKKSELEDREKEIKEELSAICQAYEIKGMKYGKCGFEYHGYQTRKTLSKERLLALGVSAEIIDQATVAGDPFLYSRTVAFDLE